MKFRKPMLAALLLMIFIACNNQNRADNKDAAMAQMATDHYKQEERNNATDTTSPAGNKENPNQLNENIDWDKKIIKTATLNLEVKDYNKYYSTLYSSIKKTGGYIGQEDQSESDYKKENVVTVKVPVAQFDEAITMLVNGTGKEKLIEKKISSEDVTGEVVDTKSRLKAKRQVRLRYLELLKQAKNMEEILQVQNEINEIQEQIELASGRVAYLNHSSAFSTIHLTFYQVLNPSASIDTEPSFLVKVSEAFKTGWEFIKELLIGLVSIWPLLLVLSALWLGFRRWKSTRVKTA